MTPLAALMVAAFAGGPIAAQAPARPATSHPDTLDGSAYAAALATLPRDTQGELAALVDSARVAGLPAAALQRKVVEGVAKHADPARIARVVRDVGAGLRAARGALGPAGDAELEAAGAAVQAGVTPDQLRRLRASLPHGRSVTQTVVILTDLIRRGVPSTDGARAIVRLARAGAGDADLAQWRAEVAADLSAGIGGGAAAARRTDTFLRQHAGVGAPVVTPAPGPLDP